MSTFIDTSVLFAAAVPQDRSHARATETLRALDDAPVTSDHVLAETWTLLNARRGRHAAMRFWRGIRSTELTIETADAADLGRALAIAEAWPDQAFSFVDCTSFAVMERLGISRAATFDEDFAIFRTGPDRSRAFQILR